MNQIKFSGHTGTDFKKNLRLLARLQKPLTTKAIKAQKFNNFLSKCELGAVYKGQNSQFWLMEAKA